MCLIQGFADLGVCVYASVRVCVRVYGLIQ